MPAAGELAPDFALTNQDGDTVRLSDFRGRRVLLFAFPRAGTSGCTKQACGFRDALPRFTGTEVVILGMSTDPPAKLKRWQEEECLPYDLLSDPENETLAAWGAWGERSMYGRKFMGVIRSHWIIDEEGRVSAAAIGVSPAKSVEQASRQLQA